MLTTKEATELTGKSAQTLRKYYRAGKVKAEERAGKFFFEAESLKPYIRRGPSQELPQANHMVEDLHTSQAPSRYVSPYAQDPTTLAVLQVALDSFKGMTQHHEEGRKQEVEVFQKTFKPVVDNVMSTSTQHYYGELSQVIGSLLELARTLFIEMEHRPDLRELSPENYQYFMHGIVDRLDLPEGLRKIMFSKQLESMYMEEIQ